MLNRLFCKHVYTRIRKIYGDEINQVDGKRYEFRCLKCGKYKWRCEDEPTIVS